MEQFTNLIEFRQALYEQGLTQAKDAQFELLDALLLSPTIRSFPELSLSPVFTRQWPSVYAAIETGEQDQAWLERHLLSQLPAEERQVFALDGTAWPHAAARTLADLQYVYSPTRAVNGKSIVLAHPYSILAWVPEPGSSWAPPVSVERISSALTDIEVGVMQVQQLCRQRQALGMTGLALITADAKYGNHRFLGPLATEPCGVVVRLRRDRVLYGAPAAYSGRGRPRVHGERFAFKEPATWGAPAAERELADARWGQVRVRRWDGLHARQDASTVFSVILVEVHCERPQPPPPFWLAYQPPPDQAPGDQPLEALWRSYDYRWPVEPSIRFRKQYLYWTLPHFQNPQRCDRWTMLVTLAYWQLFLARDLVADQPLPWQPPQPQLTPERVRQSLGGLFAQLGSPVRPPKRRGKSPGWPAGRQRTPSERHRPVKKGQKATSVA